MGKLKHWTLYTGSRQIIIYDEMIIVVTEKFLYNEKGFNITGPLTKEYYMKDCCIMPDGTVWVVPDIKQLRPYKLIEDITYQMTRINDILEPQNQITGTTIFLNKNDVEERKELGDIIREIYDMIFNRVLNLAVENKWTERD